MHKKKSTILKILLLLAILTPVLWITYHRYIKRPQNQLVAIDTATGQVKWRSSFPDDDDKFYSAPIALSKDRMLVTQFPIERDEKGQCAWIEFERHSGRVVWRKSLKELGLDGCPAPYITPVAQDGKLYTFWRKSINDGERSEQSIVAMDFTTHQVQWTSPIQMRWRDDSHQKALILTDGKLIAGISDWKQSKKGTDLKALNLQTGDTVWQAQVNGPMSSTVDKGQLINHDKSLIFLTGRGLKGNQWFTHSTDTGKLIATQSSPFKETWKILPKGDQLYTLGKTDGLQTVGRLSIAKMKVADGKFILENRSPSAVADLCQNFRDASSINQSLFVLCGEEIIALDDQTYKPKWQVQFDLSFPNIVVDPSGDRLFINDRNQIRAIDSTDGKVQWNLSTSTYTSSKLTIDGDRLFVVTSSPY